MSENRTITLPCPRCSTKTKTTLYPSIKLKDTQEVNLIKNDLLNRLSCSYCNTITDIPISVLYAKPKYNFALWYEPKHDPKIEESGKKMKGILGKSGDFISKAARIKDWRTFKAKVFQFEISIAERRSNEKDNIKNLMDYLVYHAKYTVKVRIGSIRCQSCQNVDVIAAMKEECENCKKPYPSHKNIQLMQLSLLIFRVFIRQFDEYLNKTTKENIISNITEVLKEIKETGYSPIENIRAKILLPISTIQALGGEKHGIDVVFNGNKELQFNLLTKNDRVSTNAPYNLSAIVLALESVDYYESAIKKQISSLTI